MSRIKARLGDCISAGFALTKPLRRAPGCRVLMYHSVGGDVPGDTKGLYSIAPACFADHVRCLGDLFNANAVGLETGVTGGSGLAISFDDGYRDNLTIAAPLLASAHLPFTVFITPEFVGSAPQYLSRPQVKELADHPGVSMGAHGYTHRPLTQCSDAELMDELFGSKAWIEDLLGQPVSIMSYPHGAVDARVRAAAKRAGFIMAACSRFGSHRKGDDPMQVARTDIWTDDNIERLIAKTKGNWDWLGWRT